MAGLGETVLTSLWLLLPAYLANMLPVFVGGGRPIDGGRRWRDGRRLLGDGKTWRGLLLAPPLAAALYVGLDVAADRALDGVVHLASSTPWTFAFALVLGTGALVGDALESFFKRRLGKARGERWLGFDQLDFVLGAWLAGLVAGTALAPAYGGHWFLATFTPAILAVQLVLTPALHLLVNYIGFKIGRKDVPW